MRRRGPRHNLHKRSYSRVHGASVYHPYHIDVPDRVLIEREQEQLRMDAWTPNANHSVLNDPPPWRSALAQKVKT